MAATYWIGQNGNIYYGSGQQGAPVQNLGSATGGQYEVRGDGLYDRFTDNGVPSLTYSASQIADPMAQTLGASTTSGGGGTSTAAYDQSINNTQSAINRLGTQQNSGNQAIDSSFQDALNSLLLGKNQSKQAYDTSKQQSAQGFVGAKNTIGSQAGNLLNGLKRLLGSRGAGGGSAYLQAAPSAVGRGATLQRGDATQTFGQNNQAMDQNWGNYLQGYDNSVNSAGNQRNQQKQTLQQSIDTNRASLLQSLAQLTSAKTGNVASAQPFLNQANSLLDQTANYNTSPINVNTQAYQAPSLSNYTAPQQQTPQYSQSGGGDYFSPYLSTLLGKKKTAVA